MIVNEFENIYCDYVNQLYKELIEENIENQSKLIKVKKLLLNEEFISSFEKIGDQYTTNNNCWIKILQIKNLNLSLLVIFLEQLSLNNILITSEQFLNNLSTIDSYFDEIENISKSENRKIEKENDYKKKKLKDCISSLKEFNFITSFKFDEEAKIIIEDSSWKIVYDLVVKKFATFTMKRIANKIVNLDIVNIHKSAKFKTNSINYQYSPVPLYMLQQSISQINLLNIIRNKIEEDLNSTIVSNEQYISALYIYLIIFQTNNFNELNILSIDTFHQFVIGERIYFIVNHEKKDSKKKEKILSGYSNLLLIYFEGKTTNYLEKAVNMIKDSSIIKNADNLHIFINNELKMYENYLLNIIEKTTSLVILKQIKSINKLINHLKKIHLMKEQLSFSPFEITTKITKNTPSIKLAELNALFPNTIKKEILELERYVENNKVKIKYDTDENEDNLDETLLNTEESFRDILEQFHSGYVSKQQFRNKYPILMKKLQNIIDNNPDDLYIKIYNYIKNISETFLKNNTQTLVDHFKTMHSARYRFLFDFLLVNNSFDERTFNRIERELLDPRNELFSDYTKSKYLQAVNDFLITTYEQSFDRIQNQIEHNRSIVFNFELDLLIEIHKSKITKKIKQHNLKHYTLLQPIVIYILLFYSGMRPTELATRMIQDIYKEDNDYIIDVNVNGCKEINMILETLNQKHDYTLKNLAATRRINLKIPPKYKIYIDDYYDLSLTLKMPFLVTILDSQFLPESIPILTDKHFTKIIQEIRQITKRDTTTVYSFRHSFITYSVKNIITEAKEFKLDSQNQFINLSNEAGHSSPDVTIRNYLHYGLLAYL